MATWPALLGAGALCGFLNAAASSGSAITLPLLLALGLPAGVANGTNRLPVLAGLITALWRYQRAGAIPWHLVLRLLPIFLGAAAAGARLAVMLQMQTIRVVIDVALLLALAMVLLHPQRWLSVEDQPSPQRRLPRRLQLLMGAVGFWAGLIVLDTATYLLVCLVLVGGIALPRANAIKVVLLTASVLVSLLVFSWSGEVAWRQALPLMLGSALGGWLGAGLALGPDARLWIYRLLVLALGLEVLHQLWQWLGRMV